MSFIHENKKLSILLSGLGADDIIKHSQDLGDWQTRWQLGSFLAQNLKSQLTSPVSTESGITNRAQATIGDLENLEKFAKWLADHKITWEGQRLAWRLAEERPEDALEVPVVDTANPDVVHQPDVFISKPLLLKYLTYLRDNQAVNNKTLQIKLNSIISDVNKQLLTKEDKPLSIKPSSTSTTAPSTTTTIPGTTKETQAPGAVVPKTAPSTSGAVPAGVSSDQIQRVLDSLPLTMENMDTRRIMDFVQTYIPLSASMATYGNQIITRINQMMSGSEPVVINKQPTFSLYAGPNQVITWLTPPQGSHYLSFVSSLEDILKNVRIMLEDFKYRYGSKLDKNSAALLNSQIEGPSSIWQSNWNVVESWKSRGVSVLGPGK